MWTILIKKSKHFKKNATMTIIMRKAVNIEHKFFVECKVAISMPSANKMTQGWHTILFKLDQTGYCIFRSATTCKHCLLRLVEYYSTQALLYYYSHEIFTTYMYISVLTCVSKYLYRISVHRLNLTVGADTDWPNVILIASWYYYNLLWW